MARYTAEHKKTTRERILKAAAKEFRSHGYENATIPGIMECAGLTAGGFYKHFDSKAALFAETIRAALRKSMQRSETLKDAVSEDEWLSAIAAEYLTQTHRQNLRGGCVMAALASDMPRAGKEARQAFEEEIVASIDARSGAMSQDGDEEARQKTWAHQALLLGGLIMARGVASSEVAEEILEACRNEAEELGQG